MTKPRDPSTFAAAIHIAVDLLGWKEAARITRRAIRTVRHWSESDRKGLPTLDRAIALDRAYLAAGGGYAPILESYARQLEMDVVTAPACRAEVAELIAALSRETGDAVGHCIQALQPGATPAVIYRAIVETEETAPVRMRLVVRLKALLTGTGARSEATGVQV